jgi:hypothetical protein
VPNPPVSSKVVPVVVVVRPSLVVTEPFPRLPVGTESELLKPLGEVSELLTPLVGCVVVGKGCAAFCRLVPAPVPGRPPPVPGPVTVEPKGDTVPVVPVVDGTVPVVDGTVPVVDGTVVVVEGTVDGKVPSDELLPAWLVLPGS